MEVIKKQKLFFLVMNAIIAHIEEQGLQVGDQLPSEPKLAQLLGISRPSVREAIRILEITGRLKVEQGKGIFVQDPSFTAQFSPFREWVAGHQELLREHFEVRLIIEPHAAEKAALRRIENDIPQIKILLRGFEKAVQNRDVETQIRFDQEFHLIIAKASENRTIYELMKTFTRELNEGWISTLHTPGRSEATIKEHYRIFKAVETRNPLSAAETMKKHLVRAISDLGLDLKEEKKDESSDSHRKFTGRS